MVILVIVTGKEKKMHKNNLISFKVIILLYNVFVIYVINEEIEIQGGDSYQEIVFPGLEPKSI